MNRYAMAQREASARIRAAVAQSTPRPDPLPYGLVFDVDAVSGVTIRPAARPALADFVPGPRPLTPEFVPGRTGRR